MREAISGKLLKLLQKHDIRLARRVEAAVLCDLAARSFGMAAGRDGQAGGSDENRRGRSAAFRGAGRSFSGSRCMTAKDPLKTYAEFTVRCMEETVPDESRLYAEAYRLGSLIRQITGLTKEKDLRRLIEYLYRNIDISLRWISADRLVVRKCYFGGFYTPEQCRLMSNVDSGIIGGILGGGHIDFNERITEGCGRCRACYIKEKGGQNEQQ